MALKALILDYGNVLSQPQGDQWFEVMAAEVGAPRDTFRAAYWRHRLLYDTGLPAREYWGRVLETLGAGSRGRDDGCIIDRLIDADVASWTQYREQMWMLARSFRDGGGRTAFLSNGVPEAMARIREDRRLEAWFDTVVVSCEVGIAKPDPAIYWLCLSRIGRPPHDALFVDDRPENLEAAATLGIQTFHFTGDDAVPPLVELVRLLSR
jgi:putative hydrolase of the HAD superfamily